MQLSMSSEVDIEEIINKAAFQSAQRTQSVKDQKLSPPKFKRTKQQHKSGKVGQIGFARHKRPTGAILELARKV